MDNTQRIKLDILDNQTYEQIYTKQYNKGFTLEFEITKNGEAFSISNAIAVFEMKKPDNTTYVDYCTISGNIISIEVSEQMTSANGKAEFQITLYDLDSYNYNTKTGDVIISTVTGIMKVDKSAVQNGDIESGDVFNLITEVLAQISQATEILTQSKELLADAETHANNASVSANSAKTYANNASKSATDASTSASEAAESASDASESASEAATSASNAKTSETNASQSENNSKLYADTAMSYAIGEGNIREEEETDNAKYYYEKAKSIANMANEKISETELSTLEIGDFWLQPY